MKSTVTNISSSSQKNHTGHTAYPWKKDWLPASLMIFFPASILRVIQHPPWASGISCAIITAKGPATLASTCGGKMAIVQHIDRKSSWDQFVNDNKWLFNLKGVGALSWTKVPCLLDCIIKWGNTFMDTNRLFHEMTNKVGQCFHAFKYVKPFNYVVMPYIKFLITSPHSNGWKVGTPRKWSIENPGNLRLEKWWRSRKDPQSYCPNMCNFSLPYTFGHGKVDGTACALHIGIGAVLLLDLNLCHVEPLQGNALPTTQISMFHKTGWLWTSLAIHHANHTPLTTTSGYQQIWFGSIKIFQQCRYPWQNHLWKVGSVWCRMDLKRFDFCDHSSIWETNAMAMLLFTAAFCIHENVPWEMPLYTKGLSHCHSKQQCTQTWNKSV